MYNSLNFKIKFTFDRPCKNWTVGSIFYDRLNFGSTQVTCSQSSSVSLMLGGSLYIVVGLGIRCAIRRVCCSVVLVGPNWQVGVHIVLVVQCTLGPCCV